MSEKFFSPDRNNQKARDELGADLTGNHSETLYDQNEDAAGEKIDFRTGLPFDNTRPDSAHEEGQIIIDSHNHGTAGDVLPDLPKENDAAARWLRENGHG